MNLSRLTSGSLLALFLLPLPASAHGGVYPPPYTRPTIPPPSPPARPRSPTPSAPTPTAPAARPRPGGPSTPGPKNPAAPRNGGQTNTPQSNVLDLTDWSWWWAYNEDPYVDLRRRVRASGSLTGTESFYLGKGMKEAAVSLTPSKTMIQEKIGPALLATMKGTRDVGVRSSTLVALAKLHPTFVMPEGELLIDFATDALAASEAEVVNAAILALGLIAENGSAEVLADIVDAGDAGKELLKRTKVAEVTRVNAAYALGLIGQRTDREEVRRYIVHRLARVLENKSAAPDLPVACVTSIGLNSLADSMVIDASLSKRGPTIASSRFGQVSFLCELLNDRKQREYVRAHIPKALGRLSENSSPRVQELAKRTMIDLLGSRKKVKRLVRYGLVEGLGMTGDADMDPIDVELRKALHDVARDGDAFESDLALVSIALVSSRPGIGEGGRLEALRGEQVYLMKIFSKAKDRRRPWAAMAIGLQGYHARAEGALLFESTSKALRWTFDRTRSAQSSGAYCIAFGLRGDKEAIPAMLDRLENTGNDAARGLVAISLGLAGARDAVESLQEIVADSRYHPTLLRDAAVALALLGRKDVAMDLVEILADGRSSAVRAAAVSAIGFVGDARVVEPLIKLMEDSTQQDRTQALAARALGIVCEEDAFHWSADYNNHMNYSSLMASQTNASGTGFLDQK